MAWNNYEDRQKSWLANQNILMECDQMSFIFNIVPLYRPHNYSIGAAELG